jgi:hypothetical protein
MAPVSDRPFGASSRLRVRRAAGEGRESEVLLGVYFQTVEAFAPLCDPKPSEAQTTLASRVRPDAVDLPRVPEILWDVYANGTRASTGIGNVEDIVYCEGTGPNTIAVRAIDTSGNTSPFSNEIVFVC